MGAEITFSEEEGLITVREHGTVSAQDFAGTVDAIREIHARTGIARVLVDAREQASITEGVSAYERARHAAEMLGAIPIRVAVVVVGPHVPGHRFFATVSQNRGLLVNLFEDEPSAREWLRG